MYIKHFGFSEKPFELSPNPKFFFLAPGHRSALEALSEGIKKPQGWAVLTGEVGTGKTMLIYELLTRIPKRVKSCFIFHSTFRWGELVEQILQEAGEPVAGKMDQPRERLAAFLEQLRSRGEVLALLIDEAQKLAPPVVKELFALAESTPWMARHFRLILVGQPELEGLLNTLFQKRPPQNRGVRLSIQPLTGPETVEYIAHRLRIVGSSPGRVFSPSALAAVAEYSRGIPRVVNILCDNALLAGYTEGLSRIELPIIRRTIENLEGPGNKSKRFQGGPGLKRAFFGPYRLWLVVVLGLTLGGGFWLLSGGGMDRLFSSPGRTLHPGRPGHSADPVKPPLPVEIGTAGPLSAAPDGPPIASEETNTRDSLGPAVPDKRLQVRKGASLSKISREHYGLFNESLIDLIMDNNPSIREVDLILENQVIQLPEIRAERLLRADRDHGWRILLGTFKNAALKVSFKEEPVLKGKTILVRPRRGSSGGTWYRLEAQGFGTREEALTAIEALRQNKRLPFFQKPT